VIDLLVSIFYARDRKHSFQVIFLFIVLLIYALSTLCSSNKFKVTISDCLCSSEVSELMGFCSRTHLAPPRSHGLLISYFNIFVIQETAVFNVINLHEEGT
jgi:hypothetical protein